MSSIKKYNSEPRIFPLSYNMCPIKFSITIPAYKAKFFKECITSILAQTYDNFELIIVNDNSPDNLDRIVSCFDDPRIRYYKNETRVGGYNLVHNWNKCLDYCTGDYMICMGDDDKLLPCCLSEYIKLIKQFPGLNVYHAWTQIIDDKSNVFTMTADRGLRESCYSIMWHRVKGRRQFIGDYLFHVNKLREMGGFYFLPYAWGSDDITVWRSAAVGGIANGQVPMFQFRVNTLQISNVPHSEDKMKAIIMRNRWMLEFLEKKPDNEIDIIYYHDLINGMLDYDLRNHQRDLIERDLRAFGNGRLKYWIEHRDEYGISLPLLNSVRKDIWTQRIIEKFKRLEHFFRK